MRIDGTHNLLTKNRFYVCQLQNICYTDYMMWYSSEVPYG